MVMPRGFEVWIEAFISLPFISKPLTVPADQKPLRGAYSEVLVMTAASMGWGWGRIYTKGLSHFSSCIACLMGPMDPMQACVLEMLSTHDLPSTDHILGYENNPWQKYGSPQAMLSLRPPFRFFPSFYLPWSLLILSYCLYGFVWCPARIPRSYK